MISYINNYTTKQITNKFTFTKMSKWNDKLQQVIFLITSQDHTIYASREYYRTDLE